jgi:hypothetical protein
MKKALATLFLLGASQVAAAGCIGPVIMGECQGTVTPFPTQNSPGSGNSGPVPNVYGPGVHQNQYGQPVVLQPQGGGIPGERLIITPNAYGPGVHSDQYGRIVKERPQ